jgi:hypothetical protein
VVVEMEKMRPSRLFTSRDVSVLFPVPEGAEITKTFPVWGIMAAFGKHHPIGGCALA